MELQTIEMERGAAREALRQYREDVKAAALRSRTEADRELAAIDAAVMRGYRELARGNRILELSKTIAAGGVVEIEARAKRWHHQRGTETEHFTALAPALAAIRADARSCWMRPLRPAAEEDGFRFQADGWQWHPRKTDQLSVPGGVFAPGDEYGARGLDVPPAWALNNCQLKAMVPTIPPALRHALRGYVILWEADWTVGAMIPPGDPALLKHLGGDMYALLAVWDLTPLERAVLAGARS